MEVTGIRFGNGGLKWGPEGVPPSGEKTSEGSGGGGSTALPPGATPSRAWEITPGSVLSVLVLSEAPSKSPRHSLPF